MRRARAGRELEQERARTSGMLGQAENLDMRKARTGKELGKAESSDWQRAWTGEELGHSESSDIQRGRTGGEVGQLGQAESSPPTVEVSAVMQDCVARGLVTDR